MNTMKKVLCWTLLTLATLPGYGQAGADPAVTAASALPNPVAGIGAPITLSFTIGNNGSAAITGANSLNRMGFSISLGKCGAAPSGLGALSGTILDYFNITYYDQGNGYFAFLGQQKPGVVIPAHTLLSAVISATVTEATDYSGPNTAVTNIGAACNIAPNVTSLPQPDNNDFLSAYTRTATPMPVSLITFKAEAQPNKTVDVSWETSMESGNKGYLIERSVDLKHFDQIGEITDVAINSRSLNTYKYTDPNPYRGVSYYRLKQVDLTGASRTYAAVSVVVDGAYGVHPNPVTSNGFTVLLDEPESAVMQLFSTMGRSVEISRTAISSTSVAVKPSEKLVPGIYILRVEERGLVRTHRLTVLEEDL